jgi:hypothetical protein
MSYPSFKIDESSAASYLPKLLRQSGSVKNANDLVSAFSTAIVSGLANTTIGTAETAGSLDALEGMSGGAIGSAILSANKLGVCTEKEMPSMDFGQLDGLYEGLLLAYEGAKKDREACSKGKGLISNEALFGLIGMAFLNAECQLRVSQTDSGIQIKKRDYKDQVKECVATRKAENEQRMNLAMRAETAQKMLQIMFQDRCKASERKRRPFWADLERVRDIPLIRNENGRASLMTREEKRKVALSAINRSLDYGFPTGIGFLTGGLIRPGIPTMHGLHAGIVAGRQTIQGNCYYLVRNSWGAKWPKEKDLKGLKAFKPSDGYPGYFVVAEDDLLDHMISFTEMPLDPDIKKLFDEIKETTK